MARSHGLAAAAWLIGLAVGLPAVVRAFALFPPAGFPDRAAIEEEHTSVHTSLYHEPEFASHWHSRSGAIPRGARDAFNFTRLLAPLQAQFTVDKLARVGLLASGKKTKLMMLDIGSGAGYTAAEMVPVPGVHVIALDSSRACLDELAATLGGRVEGKDVEAVQASASFMPFADDTFHAVAAFNVLEQVGELRRALSEAFRVLKPGGVFVFTTVRRSMLSWANRVWHTQLVRDEAEELWDWRLGVEPEEMKQLAEAVGFHVVHEDFTGVCEETAYSVHWDAWPWVLQAERTGFHVCKEAVNVRYMGWAMKMERAGDEVGEEEDEVTGGTAGREEAASGEGGPGAMRVGAAHAEEGEGAESGAPVGEQGASDGAGVLEERTAEL